MSRTRPPAQEPELRPSLNELMNGAPRYPALSKVTAWQRHKHLMQNYSRFNGDSVSKAGPPTQAGRSDWDAVEQEHRFLWDDKAELEARQAARGHAWGQPSAQAVAAAELSWEQRLAKRYYDSLFREYALADMSRYREGAVGLRWRTKQEVRDKCKNAARSMRRMGVGGMKCHCAW